MMASGGKTHRDGIEITAIGVHYKGPFEKKYWSSARGKQKYPYPVGYQATRWHGGHSYFMEVSEGPRGPLFVVTCEEGIVCSGHTPSGPWEEILKKRHAGAKKIIFRSSSISIDGPEMFGFTSPLVQRLCRDLLVSASGLAERSGVKVDKVKDGSSYVSGARSEKNEVPAESSSEPPLKTRRVKKLIISSNDKNPHEQGSDGVGQNVKLVQAGNNSKLLGEHGKRKLDIQEDREHGKAKRVSKRSEKKLEDLEGPAIKTGHDLSIEVGVSSSLGKSKDEGVRRHDIRTKRPRSTRSRGGIVPGQDHVDRAPQASTSVTELGSENKIVVSSVSNRIKRLKSQDNFSEQTADSPAISSKRLVTTDVAIMEDSINQRLQQQDSAATVAIVKDVLTQAPGSTISISAEVGERKLGSPNKCSPSPANNALDLATVDDALAENAIDKNKRLKGSELEERPDPAEHGQYRANVDLTESQGVLSIDLMCPSADGVQNPEVKSAGEESSGAHLPSTPKDSLPSVENNGVILLLEACNLTGDPNVSSSSPNTGSRVKDGLDLNKESSCQSASVPDGSLSKTSPDVLGKSMPSCEKDVKEDLSVQTTENPFHDYCDPGESQKVDGETGNSRAGSDNPEIDSYVADVRLGYFSRVGASPRDKGWLDADRKPIFSMMVPMSGTSSRNVTSRCCNPHEAETRDGKTRDIPLEYGHSDSLFVEEGNLLHNELYPDLGDKGELDAEGNGASSEIGILWKKSSSDGVPHAVGRSGRVSEIDGKVSPVQTSENPFHSVDGQNVDVKIEHVKQGEHDLSNSHYSFRDLPGDKGELDGVRKPIFSELLPMSGTSCCISHEVDRNGEETGDILRENGCSETLCMDEEHLLHDNLYPDLGGDKGELDLEGTKTSSEVGSMSSSVVPDAVGGSKYLCDMDDKGSSPLQTSENLFCPGKIGSVKKGEYDPSNSHSSLKDLPGDKGGLDAERKPVFSAMVPMVGSSSSNVASPCSSHEAERKDEESGDILLENGCSKNLIVEEHNLLHDALYPNLGDKGELDKERNCISSEFGFLWKGSSSNVIPHAVDDSGHLCDMDRKVSPQVQTLKNLFYPGKIGSLKEREQDPSNSYSCLEGSSLEELPGDKGGLDAERKPVVSEMVPMSVTSSANIASPCRSPHEAERKDEDSGAILLENGGSETWTVEKRDLLHDELDPDLGDKSELATGRNEKSSEINFFSKGISSKVVPHAIVYPWKIGSIKQAEQHLSNSHSSLQEVPGDQVGLDAERKPVFFEMVLRSATSSQNVPSPFWSAHEAKRKDEESGDTLLENGASETLVLDKGNLLHDDMYPDVGDKGELDTQRNGTPSEVRCLWKGSSSNVDPNNVYGSRHLCDINHKESSQVQISENLFYHGKIGSVEQEEQNPPSSPSYLKDLPGEEGLESERKSVFSEMVPMSGMSSPNVASPCCDPHEAERRDEESGDVRLENGTPEMLIVGEGNLLHTDLEPDVGDKGELGTRRDGTCSEIGFLCKGSSSNVVPHVVYGSRHLCDMDDKVFPQVRTPENLFYHGKIGSIEPEEQNPSSFHSSSKDLPGEKGGLDSERKLVFSEIIPMSGTSSPSVASACCSPQKVERIDEESGNVLLENDGPEMLIVEEGNLRHNGLDPDVRAKGELGTERNRTCSEIGLWKGSSSNVVPRVIYGSRWHLCDIDDKVSPQVHTAESFFYHGKVGSVEQEEQNPSSSLSSLKDLSGDKGRLGSESKSVFSDMVPMSGTSSPNVASPCCSPCEAEKSNEEGGDIILENGGPLSVEDGNLLHNNLDPDVGNKSQLDLTERNGTCSEINILCKGSSSNVAPHTIGGSAHFCPMDDKVPPQVQTSKNVVYPGKIASVKQGELIKDRRGDNGQLDSGRKPVFSEIVPMSGTNSPNVASPCCSPHEHERKDEECGDILLENTRSETLIMEEGNLLHDDLCPDLGDKGQLDTERSGMISEIDFLCKATSTNEVPHAVGDMDDKVSPPVQTSENLFYPVDEQKVDRKIKSVIRGEHDSSDSHSSSEDLPVVRSSCDEVINEVVPAGEGTAQFEYKSFLTKVPSVQEGRVAANISASVEVDPGIDVISENIPVKKGLDAVHYFPSLVPVSKKPGAEVNGEKAQGMEVSALPLSSVIGIEDDMVISENIPENNRVGDLSLSIVVLGRKRETGDIFQDSDHSNPLFGDKGSPLHTFFYSASRDKGRLAAAENETCSEIGSVLKSSSASARAPESMHLYENLKECPPGQTSVNLFRSCSCPAEAQNADRNTEKVIEGRLDPSSFHPGFEDLPVVCTSDVEMRDETDPVEKGITQKDREKVGLAEVSSLVVVLPPVSDAICGICPGEDVSVENVQEKMGSAQVSSLPLLSGVEVDAGLKVTSEKHSEKNKVGAFPSLPVVLPLTEKQLDTEVNGGNREEKMGPGFLPLSLDMKFDADMNVTSEDGLQKEVEELPSLATVILVRQIETGHISQENDYFKTSLEEEKNLLHNCLYAASGDKFEQHVENDTSCEVSPVLQGVSKEAVKLVHFYKSDVKVSNPGQTSANVLYCCSCPDDENVDGNNRGAIGVEDDPSFSQSSLKELSVECSSSIDVINEVSPVVEDTVQSNVKKSDMADGTTFPIMLATVNALSSICPNKEVSVKNVQERRGLVESSVQSLSSDVEVGLGKKFTSEDVCEKDGGGELSPLPIVVPLRTREPSTVSPRSQDDLLTDMGPDVVVNDASQIVDVVVSGSSQITGSLVDRRGKINKSLESGAVLPDVLIRKSISGPEASSGKNVEDLDKKVGSSLSAPVTGMMLAESSTRKINEHSLDTLLPPSHQVGLMHTVRENCIKSQTFWDDDFGEDFNFSNMEEGPQGEQDVIGIVTSETVRGLVDGKDAKLAIDSISMCSPLAGNPDRTSMVTEGGQAVEDDDHGHQVEHYQCLVSAEQLMATDISCAGAERMSNDSSMQPEKSQESHLFGPADEMEPPVEMGLEEYADIMKAGLESMNSFEDDLDFEDRDEFQNVTVMNYIEETVFLRTSGGPPLKQTVLSQDHPQTDDGDSIDQGTTKSLTGLLPQAVPLLEKGLFNKHKVLCRKGSNISAEEENVKCEKDASRNGSFCNKKPLMSIDDLSMVSEFTVDKDKNVVSLATACCRAMDSQRDVAVVDRNLDVSTTAAYVKTSKEPLDSCFTETVLDVFCAQLSGFEHTLCEDSQIQKVPRKLRKAQLGNAKKHPSTGGAYENLTGKSPQGQTPTSDSVHKSYHEGFCIDLLETSFDDESNSSPDGVLAGGLSTTTFHRPTRSLSTEHKEKHSRAESQIVAVVSSAPTTLSGRHVPSDEQDLAQGLNPFHTRNETSLLQPKRPERGALVAVSAEENVEFRFPEREESIQVEEPCKDEVSWVEGGLSYFGLQVGDVVGCSIPFKENLPAIASYSEFEDSQSNRLQGDDLLEKANGFGGVDKIVSLLGPSSKLQEKAKDRGFLDSRSEILENILDYEGLSSSVKQLDDSKKMESTLSIDHQVPVSAMVLNVRGDEIRLCVICGAAEEKERTLHVYRVHYMEDVEIIPQLLSKMTTIYEKYICGTVKMKMPMEDSAVRFTPDGQQLLLLDCFKCPDSCYLNVDECDSPGVNIISLEKDTFQVCKHLKSDELMQCLAVPGQQLLIAAGNNGSINCWEMHPGWRACKDRFSLPRATYDGVPFLSITRLSVMPGFPHMVVGCNYTGSFALWNIRSRTLLSSCELLNHNVWKADLLDIRTFNLGTAEALGKYEYVVGLQENAAGDSLSGLPLVCLLTMFTHVEGSSLKDNERVVTSCETDVNGEGIGWSCKTLILKNSGIFCGPGLPHRASAMTTMGRYGVMGTTGGLVHIWEGASGRKLYELNELEGSSIVTLATNPSSVVLGAANGKGQVVLYIQKDIFAAYNRR